MDYKILMSKLLILLLTLCLLGSLSTAHRPLPAKGLLQQETVCVLTLHPRFCKSLLPNRRANIHDHTRFAVLKSLSQAFQFEKLVNHYLRHREHNLSRAEIAALEDCRFLADLNIDYLTRSFGLINSTHTSALPTSKTDDVHTLLSAVLTNQDTCREGLQSPRSSSASTVRNDVLEVVANDARLFGVSLSLFAKGWVPKKVFTRPYNIHTKLNQHLALEKISRLIRRGFYKSLSRRKLLQAGYGQSRVVVRDVVTVSQDGAGNFTTINDAINAAPSNTAASDGYFVINVKSGVYSEYVSIGKNKKYLMMIGEGINKTIITGNRSADDGFTTFYTATFGVVGSGFVAMDITFRNTAGPRKGQAVAVRNGADESIFYRCSLEGYQDTLYSHSFRQYYRECDIYGTVDFIFGSSAVVFQNCNLYARLPVRSHSNYITAQGRTHPEENNGISILNCNIKAAADLASGRRHRVKTFLGRPWKEYSRTVYVQSYMDSIVDPTGWHEWNGDFALKTLYYAEHNNTGPGSNTAGRVKWPGYHVITAADAFNYTFSLIADDWVPHT